MIWLIILFVIVIWAAWPENTTQKAHYKRGLDGQLRFVEYRARRGRYLKASSTMRKSSHLN